MLISIDAHSHCTWGHPGHCVKDVVTAPVKIQTKIIKETANEVSKVGGEVGNAASAVSKGADDIGTTHEKGVNDVSNTIEKAQKDVDATLKKAGRDTETTVKKAGRDVNQAAIAIGHYMERQAQGMGDTLSDAEKRMREGKFIDAVWHFGIDPVRRTEENAAKLTQESTLVNALAQVAASIYGGPQGAAAYAAWFTYRATGDLDMALRVGITVGATSVAMGAAGQMPTGTSEQLLKKMVVTGAIGGIGVAASGGDEDAIFEGFLRSGGMVLVQDGYNRYTGHDIDPSASQGESYCIATLNADCSPPPEAYIRNADGTIALDSNNQPKVDMAYLDARRPHVGIISAKDATGIAHDLAEEGGVVMDIASKAPVVNAGSVFHDQWAIQWDMNRATNLATIAPAMVVTYYGTDGAINDLIMKTSIQQSSAQRDLQAESVHTSPLTMVESSLGLKHRAFSCANGELTRVVQIDSLENEERSVCQVIYQTEKGKSTPWYAEHNADYCMPKGIELVNKQLKWGWSCFEI
jgi:hypothetical protein